MRQTQLNGTFARGQPHHLLPCLPNFGDYDDRLHMASKPPRSDCVQKNLMQDRPEQSLASPLQPHLPPSPSVEDLHGGGAFVSC